MEFHTPRRYKFDHQFDAIEWYDIFNSKYHQFRSKG